MVGMKRSAKHVLGMVVIASLFPSVSRAANVTPSIAEGSSGANLYSIYVVDLTTDTGLITAIQMNIQAPDGMNQWYLPGCGVFYPEVIHAEDLDSHFTFFGSEVSVNPAATSESDTHFQAAFTVNNPFVSQRVAQVVFPYGSGRTAHATGFVTLSTSEQVPLDFVIPEPGTMVLLALGGLAFVRRRH
jgi:hypothetical protein